jgi:hypothetical protein
VSCKHPRQLPNSRSSPPRPQACPPSWNFFTGAAYAARLPKLHGWLDRHGEIVGQQIASRVTPRSNGPIEDELARVRELLERRRLSFRNRERMNRPLMLIQLELLGLASEARYARDLRTHLIALDGMPGSIRDPLGRSSLRR